MGLISVFFGSSACVAILIFHRIPGQAIEGPFALCYNMFIVTHTGPVLLPPSDEEVASA